MSAGNRPPARKSSSEHVPHRRVESQHSIWEWYDVGKLLGKGSFGKVYEVTEKKTDIKWACKKISKEKAGDPNIKLLEREVSILKCVDHPHIIRLKEVFETPKAVNLIMELCEDGSLYDVWMQKRRFEESSVKLILQRLARAVEYLHKQDMVHRDLKLQNILLSSNPSDPTDRLYIKITDFGLAIKKDGVGYDHMMSECCGTPTYMAPEIISNKTYSEKCDVWSLGVIMFALLFGYLPFESPAAIQEANISKALDDTGAAGKRVSQQAKDCMCKMLHMKTPYRYTASEVLLCPWISGNVEVKDVLTLLSEFGNGESDADDDVLGESEVHSTDARQEPPVDTGSDSGSTKDNTGSAAVQKTSMPRSSSQPEFVRHKTSSAIHLLQPAQKNGVKSNSSSRQASANSTKRSTVLLSGMPGHSSSYNTVNGLHSHLHKTTPTLTASGPSNTGCRPARRRAE